MWLYLFFETISVPCPIAWLFFRCQFPVKCSKCDRVNSVKWTKQIMAAVDSGCGHSVQSRPNVGGSTGMTPPFAVRRTTGVIPGLNTLSASGRTG